jgi:hypothetical protein
MPTTRHSQPRRIEMSGQTCLCCRDGFYQAVGDARPLKLICPRCGHETKEWWLRVEFLRMLTLSLAIHTRAKDQLASARRVIDEAIAGFSLRELEAYRAAAHTGADGLFMGWDPDKLAAAHILTKANRR